MFTRPDPRHHHAGPARRIRTALAALAASTLLLGACGDDAAKGADATADTGESTSTTTTTTTGDDGATSSSVASAAEPIVGEFHAIDPGRRRIDTLGIPLVLEVTGDWKVQPNHAGVTVLTHPDSQGPADRDVVFFRPTGLVEPDRVNDSPEGFRSQEGWPMADIDGWLERVRPGLIAGGPTDTTLGGRDAVRFDVEPTDDFPCGPVVCGGFITNKWVDSAHFERGQRRTIWWVDGGDHGPLSVMVGRDADDTAWLATAETLLDTVELGEPGPHPIGDRNPVELGLPGDVAAGEPVETPNLGGLRFTLPEDRFVHQSPGFIAVTQGDLPAEIDLVRVVETPDGEPIDDVDALIAILDEATITLEETGTTTIADLDARVFDMTAEPNPEPHAKDAIFRTVEDGVGGFVAPAEGRLWVVDTPRGLLLLTAEVIEPGAVELDDMIAQAEAIFATLELVEVG